MANETWSGSPKIYKHVDACSFPFYNDQNRCIEAGETVEVGGLTGFTNVPIGPEECGQAQLAGGAPVMGYRMYLTTPLASDVMVGDRVLHPTTGKYLGLAIHQMLGHDKTQKALCMPAAPAGTTCVFFLALPDPEASGTGTNPTTVEHACVTVSGAAGNAGMANFPTTLPVVDGTDTVTRLLVNAVVPAGETLNVDALLGTVTNKAALPEGYEVQIKQVGDAAGQLTKTADVTGDAITFGRNEFITVACCDGNWVWV